MTWRDIEREREREKNRERARESLAGRSKEGLRYVQLAFAMMPCALIEIYLCCFIIYPFRLFM